MDGTACSVCKRNFDFQCSGITETGYRRLGDRKNTWRCPQCKSSASPSRPTSSPLPSQLDKMQEQLTNIVFQLAPLATLVNDVKSIKTELNTLRDSLDMAHELLGNFSGSVKLLESRVSKVEKAIDDIPTLQGEVIRLNQELQDRDQWARANNVEIRGVPLKKNENLYDIAEKIGSISAMTIKKEAINYIARIPTRVPNAEKPIVISFNNRYTKEEFVASARRNKKLNLDNLGFTTGGVFYVNDHLTQHNKNLLSKARSLAKENNFQYIWVKHCKIMARKSDTSPIFFIKTEKDLAKII